MRGCTLGSNQPRTSAAALLGFALATAVMPASGPARAAAAPTVTVWTREIELDKSVSTLAASTTGLRCVTDGSTERQRCEIDGVTGVVVHLVETKGALTQVVVEDSDPMAHLDGAGGISASAAGTASRWGTPVKTERTDDGPDGGYTHTTDIYKRDGWTLQVEYSGCVDECDVGPNESVTYTVLGTPAIAAPGLAAEATSSPPVAAPVPTLAQVPPANDPRTSGPIDKLGVSPNGKAIVASLHGRVVLSVDGGSTWADSMWAGGSLDVLDVNDDGEPVLWQTGTGLWRFRNAVWSKEPIPTPTRGCDSYPPVSYSADELIAGKTGIYLRVADDSHFQNYYLAGSGTWIVQGGTRCGAEPNQFEYPEWAEKLDEIPSLPYAAARVLAPYRDPTATVRLQTSEWLVVVDHEITSNYEGHPSKHVWEVGTVNASLTKYARVGGLPEGFTSVDVTAEPYPVVYAGSDKGIVRSIDFGKSYQPLPRE